MTTKTLTPSKSKLNQLIVQSLKNVKETSWVGNLKFDTIEKALSSVNLSAKNGGWCVLKPFNIKGVSGFFTAFESGQINFESRILQTDEGFLIEEITLDAYNDIEAYVSKNY